MIAEQLRSEGVKEELFPVCVPSLSDSCLRALNRRAERVLGHQLEEFCQSLFLKEVPVSSVINMDEMTDVIGCTSDHGSKGVVTR